VVCGNVGVDVPVNGSLSMADSPRPEDAGVGGRSCQTFPVERAAIAGKRQSKEDGLGFLLLVRQDERKLREVFVLKFLSAVDLIVVGTI
jgi:hypothetical protein